MQPTKRKRVETETDPAEVDPIRSDIWFDDGNIVIQTENVQFRVYKGPLCSDSHVLKQMVEDIADSKGVDGCATLHLSDSSIDVGYLLRTIFYRWSYPDNEPIPFDVISAFFQLGRTYGIQLLYQNTFLRLDSAFPSSRDQYLASQQRTRISVDVTANPRNHIAIETILLARQLDLPILLPAAFWVAATRLDLMIDKIISLSAADKRTIISSATPLRVAHASYLFGWLDENYMNPECKYRAACIGTKARYALKMWKPPTTHPMFSWNAASVKGMCASCADAGRKYHTEGSKRLWEELPSFFGLPPWEELLAP
ncbi:hypothetical protein DFH09DRAFT_1458786 [Mycena vulgaris]|nr:hypothetical protein DFH09DRAFT_1458786 [Mycena vulgaris]